MNATEKIPYTLLHYTTWTPEHGECTCETTYRIQSADDLAYQLMRMQSEWIYEEYARDEYREDAAAVRRAIAAGEHMRAWITQDTDAGKIELARSEMSVATYAAALAPAITG